MNIQNTYTLHREEKTSHANPMLRRISKVEKATGEVATYSGIFGKFAYFMLMIIVGIALAMVFKSTGALGVEAVTQEVIASKTVIITALVSLVTFILLPLLAFAIRRTIPVTGALYCIGTGYMLGFVLALDASFGGYMVLAMAVTISLVLAMGFLYFKGIIHISNKFRAITRTLFATMVLSSIALAIGYFVPGMRDGILMLADNPVIAIGGAIVGVVIASLFLLIDFETVSETVRDRLPKEYEWYAAFGVAFTVVWLYFRVLDLVIKLKDASV